MRIVRHVALTTEATLDLFRYTRLKGFDNFPIYEHASLSIETMDIGEVVPSQLYTIRNNVENITEVGRLFADIGIDIYNLTGVVLFWLEVDGMITGPIPIAPPIIEISEEVDGSVIKLINDGMHRITSARKVGRTQFSGILVRDVPVEYPYYALPAKNGWASVVELDELPDNFVKKIYRYTNYKDLFRNFNDIFPGIQEQRKQVSSIVVTDNDTSDAMYRLGVAESLANITGLTLEEAAALIGDVTEYRKNHLSESDAAEAIRDAMVVSA